MSWDKTLLEMLGVSAGDADSVARYRSALAYALASGYRSLLRLLANHCIIPSLRVALFRWSGIRIGARTRINMNVNFLDGFTPSRIQLESEVAVAPFVSLVAESHPNDSILQTGYGMLKSGPILIKKGAWLGVGAVILPGVTVGESAIIGANAVVTQDVENYAIMAGIPAKKIGDVRLRDRKPGEAG